MYDDEDRLQDDVLAVVEQFQSFAESYRHHCVGLLDRFWPFGTDVASADLGAGADLLVHIAQLVTMEAYTRDLLGVLENAEERRIDRVSNRPQPPGGSDSAEA